MLCIRFKSKIKIISIKNVINHFLSAHANLIDNLSNFQLDQVVKQMTSTDELFKSFKVPPVELLMRCAFNPSPAPNGSSTISLNDDCLVEILKRMGTDELITLSRLCNHCLDLIKERIFPWHTININELQGKFGLQEVLACLDRTLVTLQCTVDTSSHQ